ncbi:hypothetical protein [Pseudoalteromonas caenipelagi]|nr:hypothetical protein [Pseudoalteromonas caenipelagi]
MNRRLDKPEAHRAIRVTATNAVSFSPRVPNRPMALPCNHLLTPT